jgi:hypothetical protein
MRKLNMRRRKTAKRTTKRTTTNKKPAQSTSNLQTWEKDFWQAPAKIAAQLKKEIQSLKQTANKLQTAADKMEARMHTAKGKTQSNKAKKAYMQLSKQLQAVTKNLTTLSNNQNKMAALRKYLTLFNQEWAKLSKKAVTATAPKAKARKAVAKPQTQPYAEEQSRVETEEPMVENSTIEEEVEINT